MKAPQQTSRRGFLKTGAVLGGALLIQFSIPVRAGNIFAGPPNGPERLNAYLRIDRDSSVEIIISKVEMGQGIWTTLAMLIAEELDCDWEKIKVEHRIQNEQVWPETDVFAVTTGGSDTTKSEFDRYRMVGATARLMLVNAAAARFGVAADDCQTANGFVIYGKERLSYGELVSEASPGPAPMAKLRDPSQWRLIGKSKKRLDSPEKVYGKAKYGIDTQFPGMLTAVVCYPPVFGGKVSSFDAAKARAVPGVRNIVQISTGIAVIGDNFWSAKQGRDAMQIKWDLNGVDSLSTTKQIEEYRKFAALPGKVSQQRGDATSALARAFRTLEAEFIFPYLSHSPMEPLNCAVKLDAEKCEVWTGTQGPAFRQKEIADFLGFKTSQVTVHTPFLGGSFGRRGSFSKDWVIDAVEIAKISGKAIKLVWTREDDIKGGYYRPLHLHQVRIGLGKDGFPLAWHHRIVGQSLFKGTVLEEYIVSNGIDHASVDGAKNSPYLADVNDCLIDVHAPENKVPVLPWRSVGNTHTAFVMETLIDELAVQAGKDSIAYRKMILKDYPGHLAVLDFAAERAAWSKPLADGIFRGLAIHEAMGSVVCQIVELSVKDKEIKPHRVVCAIDCGLAVNPDGVKAQMESGIVYGLTAALYGEITLENGRVQQNNFYDYKMLRMNEMPAIEVHILPGKSKMGGVGEPGVPPIAPALANALFAATGKRIRKLPVKMSELY